MNELNASNFDKIVNNSPVALIDFWAPWCGPCRALSPIIKQIANDVGVGGDVYIAKVNIDESPELAEKFDVRSIPTLIYFKFGQEIERSVGMTAKADILDKLSMIRGK